MDENDVIDPAAAEENRDRAYVTAASLVEDVLDAVRAGDRERLVALLEPLHPADVADILEQLSSADRIALIRLYDRELDGDVLAELDESIREEVIAAMSPEALAEAVRELESDDLVDIVEDLDEPQKEAILDALEDDDEAVVRQSLSYPEDSAGRLMQREVVTAPADWTVGQAIDWLRAAEELPEDFYHIILVDPGMHPVGMVSLGRLMASRRDVRLSDIADEDFFTIPVTQDVEDVAYAFNKYHLISAPVVDTHGRLVGIITIDDAMEVLEEEAEEDIMRLAGVGEESLSDNILEIASGRFVWLFVNLVTAIIASLVIDHFSDSIDKVVALAVLMPIVASMGGNAGTQSMTVAVRAIATRDLTVQNAFRVIRREIAAGALNGIAFGVIMAAVAGFWFDVPMLPWVIAVAMLLTLVAAALGGIMIPILLDRLGVDPALASGPFVTTVTDVVGFFTFLGLASAVLL